MCRSVCKGIIGMVVCVRDVMATVWGVLGFLPIVLCVGLVCILMLMLVCWYALMGTSAVTKTNPANPANHHVSNATTSTYAKLAKQASTTTKAAYHHAPKVHY